MRAKLSRLHYVLHELRRRHVIRVLGAYVFCGWVILQVAAIVFPPLLVPDWVLTVLVVLTIVGLPLVAVLTWTYDITPRGVVRTRPLPNSEVESLRINWHYVDLVIIAALLSVLVFVLMKTDEPTTDLPGRSIAVIPFNDLSEHQGNAYFSDGLSEALIDSLARIHGLRVMSRTSSFAIRDRLTDVRSLADELSVDNILEGSVRKSGNRVLVSTRLVDGRHGHSLWSHTYEATLDDIFQVQENIARSIADVLQIQLMGDEDLVGQPPRNEDAYDLYLRGRAYLRREGVLENIESAIDYFNRALELDRRFALARAGLCTAHWQRYEYTRDADLVPEALEVCHSAEIYDDQRSETQVALGNFYIGTGQYERADAAFHRALEIEPRRSDIQLGFGYLMTRTGHPQDAEHHYLRAIDLDPAYWRNYSYYSALLAGQGRLEEAIEAIQKAIRLEPANPRLYSNLSGFYIYLGQYDKAARAAQQSIDRFPLASAYSNAGTAYFHLGNYERAEAMFRAAIGISPADYRLHMNLAEAIAMQPDRDEDVRAYYESAIDLGRERLEVNPADHTSRAALARNLAMAGHLEQADAHLRQLEQESNLDQNAHRWLGEASFLIDDMASALTHTEQALAMGLPPEQIGRNPRLSGLRNHPHIASLISQSTDSL